MVMMQKMMVSTMFIKMVGDVDVDEDADNDHCDLTAMARAMTMTIIWTMMLVIMFVMIPEPCWLSPKHIGPRSVDSDQRLLFLPAGVACVEST